MQDCGAIGMTQTQIACFGNQKLSLCIPTITIPTIHSWGELLPLKEMQKESDIQAPFSYQAHTAAVGET